MIVIGIVGSPAGGKSTVASQLQELGATWINADRIAHQVLDEDRVRRQLIERFGSQITDSHGRIDRGELAQQVFGDDDQRRAALVYLEDLVHPETGERINEQLRQAGDRCDVAVILDVPLLFESGWDLACDEIWCVDAPREQRIGRVIDRGWTDEQLQRREVNQLAISEKRRLSTVVIDNDGTLEQLTDTINHRWGLLIERNKTTANQLTCPSSRI